MDKMPHNFLYVPVIRTLFPNARIIHCQRNAMDNCFSIYQQHFTGTGHPYAYDLQEIAEHYLVYRDLMGHWEQVFPGFCYSLQYEELVSNPEESIRALLGYCDLTFEPACLEFHETRRAVATASGLQVRQPMHENSVSRWEKYSDYLTPLKRALGDAATP